MEPNPLYVLLVLPALLILIITVGISGSIRARSERIEQLREKVKALPFDEKTREKRLKKFDDICQRVSDYNTKIRLLEKLTRGKEVEIKKKGSIEPNELRNKKDDIMEMIILGILPRHPDRRNLF